MRVTPLASALLLISLAGVCASLPAASTAHAAPAPPAPAARTGPAQDAQAAPDPAQVKSLIEDGRYLDAERLGARLLREAEVRHGAESLQAVDILDLIVEAQWRGGTAHRPEALERAERAAKIRKKAQGSEHPDLARSLAYLGKVLIEKADYPRAEEVCAQALALSEKAPGTDPLVVAESLHCLGGVRTVNWDYAGATALYERAVSLLERDLGSSHPRVARVLTDLGLTLRKASELARGREILGRALGIQERALRPAHPDIAQTLIYLGIVLVELREVAESKQKLERAAQISEQSFGAESPRLADALNGLLFPLWAEGDYAGAIRLGKRALAIKEKAFGPDHHALSVSLYNLADSLRETGDYAGARPLYERALALDEKYLGAEHPDVAWTLRSLGALLVESGDRTAAVPYLERALALQEKTLGPGDLQVAWTLTWLGASAYDLTGSYTRAREHFERALAIYERTLGTEHDDYGWTLTNLAKLVARTGRYEEARPLFSRALSIRVKATGRDHPYVAWTLNQVGSFHNMVGEVSQARSCFEKALSMYERLEPNHTNHRGASESLDGLAGVHMAMGDFAEASRLYEQALSITEDATGSAESRGARMQGLAWAHVAMGDFAEARRLYEQALSMREAAFGPAHPSVADALGVMGHLDLRIGDYVRAKEIFERAVAIHERSLGPDHDSVGWGLINLAITHVLLGQLDQAKSLFERGLAIRQKATGSESFTVTWDLVGFGIYLLNAGEHAGAVQTFERALSIFAKGQVPEGTRMAQAFAGLAEALAWRGETGSALDAALRAEEIGRRRLGLEARALAERQALRYASVRASGLGLALSLASSAPRPESVARAWDSLIRSRSLVLDEMAARHHKASEIFRLGDTGAGQRGVSEITRLSRQVVQANERLARLMVRGPGGAPVEEYRRILDQARREQESAERALAEVSGGSRQHAAQGEGGLAQVMSALPRGSALLAYARYDQFAAAEPRVAKPLAAQQSASIVPSYLALVLRWDRRQPEVARLGADQEIEDLIAAWRSEIARGATASGAPLPEIEAGSRAAGEALRRRIWDPVAGLLRGAKRVFVVPDGALHLVNLAALPVAGGKYLIEEPLLIHYLSVERDLIPASERRRLGDGLLAMGGPAFEEKSLFASLAPRQEPRRQGQGQEIVKQNQPETALEGLPAEMAAAYPPRSRRSSCGNFESMRFEALPGSEREVKDIAALWGRPGPGAPGVEAAEAGGPFDPGTGVVRLTGPRASEALFKEKAPGRRVLHLATHGFFLPGRCEPASQSARGIGGLAGPGPQKPPPEPRQAEAEDSTVVENPLLLSGLALAGANHRSAAGPDEEDGILTAEEIGALDLGGVEWAVLSACDTGLGEVKAGEGVLGLRRAFQVAGVKTLIMSLWPVEDEAAREWMKALYEGRLVRGLSTAEAVREASLAVLKGRRAKGLSTHPVSWASFVATGDWR